MDRGFGTNERETATWNFGLNDSVYGGIYANGEAAHCGASELLPQWQGDGILVLLLAVTSFILVLIHWYRQLWITSLGSAAILAFTLFNLQSTISQMRRQMETDLKDNPFRGFAELAAQSVQLEWSWAVLVIGIVLLIAVAAMKDTADDWSR